MGKLKMTAQVVSQECIATDVYSLVLKADEIAKQAEGQAKLEASNNKKLTIRNSKQ